LVIHGPHIENDEVGIHTADLFAERWKDFARIALDAGVDVQAPYKLHAAVDVEERLPRELAPDVVVARVGEDAPMISVSGGTARP
jgi:hypothetical protein